MPGVFAMPQVSWVAGYLLSFGATPLPVPDFRHVLAVLVDVRLVLDELVLELLLQIDALVAGLRQAIDRVHHEVKAVQIVEHGHVEGRGDGALFLVAAHVFVGSWFFLQICLAIPGCCEGAARASFTIVCASSKMRCR